MLNLEDRLNLKDVAIIEGFDMVGKTTAVRYLFPNALPYFANHTLTDETIGRDDSWVLGYSLLSLLQRYRLVASPLVINRGPASGVVYSLLYRGKNPHLDKVVDYYSKWNYFTHKISHLHVRHHDKESAKILFEKSQSRTVVNDLDKVFDSFSSFEDYWEMYLLAEKYYKETYQRLNITPTIIESIANGGYIITEQVSVEALSEVSGVITTV